MKFYIKLLFLGTVLTSCVTQDYGDEFSNMIRTAIDGQDKILEQIKKLKADQTEELKSGLAALKEELRTEITTELRAELALLKDEQLKQAPLLQQCSTADQLHDYFNLLTIDECLDGSNSCSEHASCTDLMVNYSCTCLSGYSGDGFTCKDVDECSDGTHTCDTTEVCFNDEGSYDCYCIAGYTRRGLLCRDIDECESTDICGVHEICQNTQGNYTCICPHGYQVEGNICHDVNECEVDPLMCGDYGSCNNTIGSYFCDCQNGHKSSGKECISCESPYVHIDGLGCVVIVEERLSWDAAHERCQETGDQLLEDITTDHLVSLSQHYNSFKKDWYWYPWVGMRNSTWVFSGKTIPQTSDIWRNVKQDVEKQDCVYGDFSPPTLGLFQYYCRSERYFLCQRRPIQ